jgi:hypothetical protein
VVTSSCKTPNGHNCTSNPEIPLYTPSKSFQSQNESFSIAYGAGPSSTFVSGWVSFLLRFYCISQTVSRIGKIGTDNVAIGNLSLLKQTFGSTGMSSFYSYAHPLADSKSLSFNERYYRQPVLRHVSSMCQHLFSNCKVYHSSQFRNGTCRTFRTYVRRFRAAATS